MKSVRVVHTTTCRAVRLLELLIVVVIHVHNVEHVLVLRVRVILLVEQKQIQLN